MAQLTASIDGVTQATPLNEVKTLATKYTEGYPVGLYGEMLRSPIFDHGDFALGWWQVNVAFLFGGIFLIWRKIFIGKFRWQCY